MTRVIGRLSVLKINALVKAGQAGMHADGGGLYLRIDYRHLSAAWVFRYRDPVTSKLRDKGLGSYSSINLKDARSIAAELRTQRAKGIDPIDAKHKALAEERDKRAKLKTFMECAESFISKEKHGWVVKTHQKWRHTIDVCCKPILHKPINDIQAEDVVAILKPIWFETTYSATRVRGRIESIFEHAKELKLFSGDNPAAWRGALRAHLPKPSDISKEKHHPALPYAQVPEFMARLCKLGAFDQSGTLSIKALALILLTACREGEVVKAEWREINFENNLWTIPGNRMKEREEHVVPLSPQAVTLLKSLHSYTKDSGYVFPSDKLKNGNIAPITIAAPYKVLKELEPSYTVHGLRSTFRSWAGATTDYPEELLEAALAHKLKDKVKAAYMRDKLIDKRRVLMNEWAAYCSNPKS